MVASRIHKWTVAFLMVILDKQVDEVESDATTKRQANSYMKPGFEDGLDWREN